MTVLPASSGKDPGMPGHRRRIEITVSVKTLLLIAFVAVAVVALVAIRGALILVFAGVFLAFVFELPTRFVARHLHVRRSIAAAIVVLGTALVVTALALVLLVPLVTSVIDFLHALPQTVQDLRDSGELSWLGDSGAANNVQQGADDLARTIPDAVGAFVGVAGAAFSAGIALFTIVFLALFLLMDFPRLQSGLTSLVLPKDAKRDLELWERITVTVSRWALGAGLIAIIAGTVQGVTAWLLGSSFGIALGVIAGLLDLIPTIGATIAGFILVPTVFAEQGLTAALIMLVVILVYQQVENNVLTPTVQGKAVDISGFFVMLGVTVFGALLGVLGALVAVPVTASLQIVFREFTAERRARIAAQAATPPPDEQLARPAVPESA
jgi:predicted PurR-regulated permease PerM